ncbi:MAG: hypothetical protein RLZZ46_230 [Bacteroidota bacterium]
MKKNGCDLHKQTFILKTQARELQLCTKSTDEERENNMRNSFILFCLVLFSPISAKSQSLKLVNLNSHDTVNIGANTEYYFAVDGEKTAGKGLLRALADSSVDASGRRLRPENLLWISKKKRMPRKSADQAAKTALGIYGLSVVISGIYYFDNGNTEPLKISGLWGAGLGIPAALWLALHKDPDYDLRGSWIAIID